MEPYLVPNGLSGLQYMRGIVAPSRIAKLLKITMTAVPRPQFPICRHTVSQLYSAVKKHISHAHTIALTKQLG